MKHHFTLRNGNKIPSVGFGTWQTPDGDVCEQAVLWALESGYRHIDTAAIYGNEESVGRAIIKSGIPRHEIFLTTKLWNDKHSYEGAKEAIAESMEKLQVDYLDLYLIHWPNPLAIRDQWQKGNSEAWRAIEEAYQEGTIKAIGVSNFHTHHLEALLETAHIVPMVNQILFNPSDMQQDIVDTNTKHSILTQAYSPLGTGKILELEELQRLADKYNKSVAQIVIRWVLHHGILPLPKSITQSRIQSNLDVFDFALDHEDITFINGLTGLAGSAKNPDLATY